MRAFIIAVGSELLSTDRIDTNSLRLTESLDSYGIHLAGKSVVGDALEDLVSHLQRAMEAADLVLVTGGLGPTTDDLTRQAVGDALGLEMAEDAAIVADIRKKFRRFGMQMPEVNRRQAMVLEGAEVLGNRRGTAPGLLLERGDRTLFLLPGVPRELEHMIEAHLEVWLAARADGLRTASRSLRVACRSESAVEEALRPVYEAFDSKDVTILASPGDIEVRFTVLAEDSEAQARLSAMMSSARRALGRSVYAELRSGTLEGVVGSLLEEAGQTVVTAESSTGGMIAERLTAVPGSSAYFLGGVVSYSNTLKQTLLGIPEALLEKHGAVSEEVAREMASGVRTRLGADFGIAATGLAGPGGGSEDKPVGLVHVAVAGSDGSASFTDHRRLTLPGERARVRRLSSQWALELLRRRLVGHSG